MYGLSSWASRLVLAIPVCLLWTACTAIPTPNVPPAMTEPPPRQEDALPRQATPSVPAVAEGAQPEVESSTFYDRALSAFPEAPQVSQGQVLLLYGLVTDRAGVPLPGIAVEIWQTDANGVYNHPSDPSTAGRDLSFQFFGTAVTDDAGVYIFRTIVPGRYEPRPRHIHVKVKEAGRELLTTQFYFAADQDEVQREQIFRAASGRGDMLYVALVPATDPWGRPVLLGRRDIVLDRGAGELAPTPSQAEGPYYPVVDVSGYDNDLTRLP
ncbi:MAG: hypothetical protein Kow0047_33240 [Anaerolineae bacterium]